MVAAVVVGFETGVGIDEVLLFARVGLRTKKIFRYKRERTFDSVTWSELMRRHSTA